MSSKKENEVEIIISKLLSGVEMERKPMTKADYENIKKLLLQQGLESEELFYDLVCNSTILEDIERLKNWRSAIEGNLDFGVHIKRSKKGRKKGIIDEKAIALREIDNEIAFLSKSLYTKEEKEEFEKEIEEAVEYEWFLNDLCRGNTQKYIKRS